MIKRALAMLTILAAVSPGLLGQTPTPAPHRASYGPEPTSFGELTLPTTGAGPFPVAILLHGGCWISKRSGVADMRPMAAMLASHGIASWNVEYRRVGHEGGGWPGTYRDLSAATEYLRELAKSYSIDLARVIAAGHSSGGYFAAWLAGRQHLPAGSPIAATSPLKLSGLVLLDTFLDPRVIDSRGTDGRLFCDEPVLPGLVGGEPDALREQLRQVSPLALLPYGIPQEYVVSSLRYPVTQARPLAAGRTTLQVSDYPAIARKAGGSVTVHIVPDADHFDFIKPGTAAWTALEAAFVRIAY